MHIGRTARRVLNWPRFQRSLLGRGLRAHYGTVLSEARATTESAIPKVPLEHRHFDNCQLLKDRADLLRNLPKGGTVAEIGVAEGDFSEQIFEICQPTRLCLIDVWKPDNPRYGEDLYLQVLDRFSEEMQEGAVAINRKLSTEAAEDFEDGYFDWIYLDTDHTYPTTQRELDAYASKVAQNGIIAGHDYSMGQWVKGHRHGVIEAVHEFLVERDWELIYLTIDPIEHQSFAIRRIPGS